ncbi:hypothetical protein GGI03_005023 [Coemansia sp. RSA 2337]|nr:hypothetical protein GGI03_005023 [Coemansia sp. RSA 2337]
MSKRQNPSSSAACQVEENAKVAAVSGKSNIDQPEKPAGSRGMDVDGDADMGEFEDAFEDEIEEDEILVEREEDSDGVEMLGEGEGDDDDEEEL